MRLCLRPTTSPPRASTRTGRPPPAQPAAPTSSYWRMSSPAPSACERSSWDSSAARSWRFSSTSRCSSLALSWVSARTWVGSGAAGVMSGWTGLSGWRVLVLCAFEHEGQSAGRSERDGRRSGLAARAPRAAGINAVAVERCRMWRLEIASITVHKRCVPVHLGGRAVRRIQVAPSDPGLTTRAGPSLVVFWVCARVAGHGRAAGRCARWVSDISQRPRHHQHGAAGPLPHPQRLQGVVTPSSPRP